MANLPPYPDSNRDTGVEAEVGPTPSTPLWVKMFGIIALVLVLLFVILHLTGRSPSGHTPSGALGGYPPPSSIIEQGVQQP